MKKIENLVHTEEVNGKKYYNKVGVLMTQDDGRQSVKLNSIPVGFTGWLNVYEQKPRDEVPTRDVSTEPEPF